MNTSGPESIAGAGKQPDLMAAQSQNLINPSGIESQLHTAADIASARHFFVPTAPAHALPGIEHGSIAAVKAAEASISPMLQLIMRLPGHLGLFSSFLEAFKNLFFSHDILSSFHLGQISQALDFSHMTNIGHNFGHSLAHLPSGLDALHQFSHQSLASIGQAQLHTNPFNSLKQSLNVSAGVDLKNPQFEAANSATPDTSATLARNSGAGEALSGPALSNQAITNRLAPPERIFSGQSFESANTAKSNMLAFNQTANPTNQLASSQPNVSQTNLNQLTGAGNSSASSVNAGQLPSSSGHESSYGANNANNYGEGLQAKALSLENVTHHKTATSAFSEIKALAHKHPSNNPFSKLASSTKQAFHSTQKEVGSNLSTHPYSIKTGDSLWQIAKNQLGNGSRWHEVYNINESKIGSDPSIIHNGTAINLPSSDNSFTPSAAPNNLDNTQYTVRPGDSLWQISKNVFGTGYKWTEIYKLNGTTIGANPRLIFSGQKLALSGSGIDQSPNMLLGGDKLAQHIGAHPFHSQPVLAQANLPEHHAVTPAPHSSSPHNVLAQAKLPEHPVTPSTHTSSTHNAVHQHPGKIHHNEPVLAHAHNAPTAPYVKSDVLQAQSAVTDNRIAQTPAPQSVAHGLTVQPNHNQLLSGAGGAQAATSHASNAQTSVNKLSGLTNNKAKSVVDFSLTPDLAQW